MRSYTAIFVTLLLLGACGPETLVFPDLDMTEPVPDVVPDVVPDRACNGSPLLCGRRFDEVAYACTHNAFANEADVFWPPNHFHTMTRQLDDGVRGLMLDLHYDDDGIPSLCHGDCFFGQRPLVDGLTELRVFLDANPGAVITLLLENYIDHEDIKAAMDASGLLELAFAHPPGTPWPTLGETIDAGNRVVVLGPDGGADHPWLLYTWTEAFETTWDNDVPEDLNCEITRGSPDNPLFNLNHFVSNPLPEPCQAATVNFNPFFLDRVMDCWEETGHIPNFVTVDFYSVGDVLAVVDALNGVD